METPEEEEGTHLAYWLKKNFLCIICNEYTVVAQSLNCSHVFCKTCITLWLSRFKDCPTCRETIIERTRVLPIDNLVSSYVETLGDAAREARKELFNARREAPVSEGRLTAANMTPNQLRNMRRRRRRKKLRRLQQNDRRRMAGMAPLDARRRRRRRGRGRGLRGGR